MKAILLKLIGKGPALSVRQYALALSVLFLLGCGSKSEMDENRKTNIEIENFLKDYYLTMSSRNWKEYESLFIKDAILTTIWAEEPDSIPTILTTTIDDFLSKTKNGPDSQPIFEEKMLNSEVSVKGNLANAWIDYTVKFGSMDSLDRWNGRDLISLMKFEGEWKIVSIVFEPE